MTQETSDDTQVPETPETTAGSVPGPASEAEPAAESAVKAGAKTAAKTAAVKAAAVKAKAEADEAEAEAELVAAAEPVAEAARTAEPHTKAESPEELREQVAQTREELGDTIAALAAKVDLKQRARTTFAQAKVQAQQAYAKVATKTRERTPQPVQDAASQAVQATEGKRTRIAAVSVGLAAVLTALKLRKRHN